MIFARANINSRLKFIRFAFSISDTSTFLIQRLILHIFVLNFNVALRCYEYHFPVLKVYQNPKSILLLWNEIYRIAWNWNHNRFWEKLYGYLINKDFFLLLPRKFRFCLLHITHCGEGICSYITRISRN